MREGGEAVTFKRLKTNDLRAKRIMRLKRIASGILDGNASQTEWARREGVSLGTINKDFHEIFTTWLAEGKKSTRAKQAVRIRQQQSIMFEAKQSFLLSKRVIYDCPQCKGEGFVKKKGACLSCDGEGTIERYDTPGDPKWLSIMSDTVKECAKLEGLGKEKKDQKEPKKHLHIHASADDMFRNAPDEDVIAAMCLVDRLQRNGKNGNEVKLLEAEPNPPPK